MLMASTISTPIFSCSSLSSSTCLKSSVSTLSFCTIPYPRTPKLCLTSWVSPMGLGLFSPWSGLKHLGISFKPKSQRIESKRKCKDKGAYASLFGVGAPEALVIGVVALLVFGPKGLAEVARNLGKTLRTFQPTIRELQEVSKEFKSTLEREIGLDDIPSSSTYNPNRPSGTSTPSTVSSTELSRSVADPNGMLPSERAYTTEEYLKITENQLKASAAKQQQQTTTILGDSRIETQTQPQGTVQETATEIPPPQKPES